MTTCTPIYGLPVVEGSDDPCDIDGWSCDFATAVESQLDALDAVVQRTSTTIPMVWIRRTTPYVSTVGSFSYVPEFDTVVVDTDNMADLTTMSTGVTFNTPGVYQIWYSARGIRSLPGGSSAAPTISIDQGKYSPILLPPYDNRQGSLAGQVSVTGSGQISMNPLQNLFLNIALGGLVGNFITWSDIHFGAFYLGDPV